MRRSLNKMLVIGAAAALFGAGVATAQSGDLPGPKLDPAINTEGAVVSNLSADNEVPPTGATGTGRALISLNIVSGRVCILFVHTMNETITGLHIHEGAAGVGGGPVRVDFGVTAGGSSVNRCTSAAPAQVLAIAANPNNFYVNAHTATYPGGAIRGQLFNRSGYVGQLFMFSDPLRAADTRATGKLAAGETRTFDLTTGRRDDGTIQAALPFAVGAALVVVTVTGTEGAGYVVAYSNALTTPPSVSTVNWSGANQDIAATTTVVVDGEGKIKITAGPTGGTNVIIDVLGFYISL